MIARVLVSVLAISIAIPLAIASPPAHAAKVLLKDSWLKAHKNRVTVTADCRIERSHDNPNGIKSSGKDGDLHVACRCADIGLPMVVEIVNAKKFPAAVDAAKVSAQNKDTKKVSGAWRLWLEHPSPNAQTQGATVAAPTNTNPKHMFEIHPVMKFGSEDVTAGYTTIPGYAAYSAKKAFTYYEKRKFTVSRKSGFTSIEGITSVLNYASFTFKLDGKPSKKVDGWIALATVEGVAAHQVRMVIAEGTPPGTLISGAEAGDRFEALGMPRIDLDKVDDAIKKHPNGKSIVSPGYEMIIVGLKKKS